MLWPDRWRRSDPRPRGALRGELLNVEHLEERARALAADLVLARRPTRSRAYLRRLDDNARALREAYRALADDVHRGGPSLPRPSGSSTTSTSSRPRSSTSTGTCPPRYHRQLPALAVPRVAPDDAGSSSWPSSSSATATLASTPPRMERFLSAYQTVAPLSLGELWAWPSALKTVLVENLRRVTDVILTGRDARQKAATLLRPLEEADAGVVPDLPGELETPFVVELLAAHARVRPARRRPARAARRAPRGAEARAPRIVIRAEQQAEATAQVSIANTVTSLQVLRHPRLGAPRRAGEPRRADPPARSRRGLRTHGLREPRPLPPARSRRSPRPAARPRSKRRSVPIGARTGLPRARPRGARRPTWAGT